MKYKIAIFDLDGTILDTLADLTDSVNYALKSNSMPERTIEEIRHFVGNGIRKLIERSVGLGTKDELIDKVHSDFTEYYKAHCADKTSAYEGIPELLKTIREAGMKTAVVSNKADYAVSALVEDFFPGQFDLAVGERPGILRKPNPDGILWVLDSLSKEKQEAVYIGDSEVDIKTAKNVGMDAILVSWGFRDKDFLKENGAEIIVDSADELLDYLEMDYE